MKSTARKKLRHGESQKGEDKRWRRSGMEKVRREKTQVRGGSGGSKSRLAKSGGCGASWPDERPKFARRCGAKHSCKSKRTIHHMLGPLSEVEVWKKCTPLWREAHLEVKSVKTPQVQSTFGS